MPYRLYFGLDFDDNTFPRPDTEGGAFYLGPAGLLHFFEAHLGLTGHPERSEHIRTEQYRQAIAKYLKKQPKAFFALSFGADQLACAEAILTRRDELLLAGGQGVFQWSQAPLRIQHIIELEKELFDNKGRKTLLAGYADRFDAVIVALAERPLSLDRLKVHEPLEHLPPQYQRLFDVLARQRVAIESVVHPKALLKTTTDSDLNRLKRFMAQPQSFVGKKQRFEGDGSLVVIEADRDTEAAAFMAKVLSKNRGFKPVFLIPDKNRSLDEALTQEGLPNFGLPSNSLGRPTLQLLKLVTTFLWRPLDPHKVLEFVTLASKPLADDLALIIANLIAERPGIDGEQWFYKISTYFEELAEKEAQNPKNIEKIRKQYEFWFKRPTHDITEAVPKSEAIGIFDYLQKWAADEYETAKNGSLLVLSEQAKRIKDLLEEWPAYEYALSHLQLERIIRTIYEPAPIQPTTCAVGHYPYVHSETALTEPVEQLVWWYFVDVERPAFFARWYADEMAFLAAKNVFLQSPKSENAVQLWAREQPIFNTKDRLFLVYPKKINGYDTAEHPLMSHLNAGFENVSDVVFHVGAAGADAHKHLLKLALPMLETVPQRLLGKTPALLPVDSQKWRERTHETPTSIESLLYYPHQWAFKYKARLVKSSILTVAAENKVKGNLAHRFFELILKEDCLQWSQERINAWIDENSRSLMRREAATLMMYGFEPDRVQFIRKLKYAIGVFIALVRSNGWSVVGTERPFEGRVLDTPIKGKTDVLLARQDEWAVVDLKWSGQAFRRGLITNDADLQLVTYSRFANNSDQWAHTAYFIIEEAVMLARNNKAFSEIKPLAPQADALEKQRIIWERMEKTYAWRLAQLNEGLIEIRTSKTVPVLEEIYGADLLDVLELPKNDAKFDDYDTLVGQVS